jgi:prepilin-type processing-associated H-X9-DG protein
MAIALNRGKAGRTNAAGLTLVELMVVVAMTALLSALLLPALSTAKEKSRRAVCKSNIRQLVMVLQEYAFENEQYLPSSADNKGYFHSIILSDAVFSNLVELASGNSNIFYCPNIVFSSDPGAMPQQHILNTGYVIGYSYLASSIYGSQKSPDYTVEAVKWPPTATNELLADANYWTSSASPGYFPALMKVAPHTPMGAAMARSSSFTVGLPGNSSASIGAVGGNVGFFDGHVEWLTLPKMQTNYASSLPGAYGAW